MSEELPAPEADAPGASHDGLRWTAMVVACITAALVLLNAEAGRNWANGLPPTPVNEGIRSAANGWADFTARAGLSSIRRTVRTLWEGRHARQWPAGRAADPGQR